MKEWLREMLFDWVFVLLYKLLQAFLNLVDFIESFFDVFAGTAKIFYKGNSEFLFNVFFGHSAVTNAFWAMALIAVVMAFGFCIVQLARKSTDVTGSVKQSVGQIISNFLRCMLIIVMLNAGTVAAINISNVLLDRINYAMENAAILHQGEEDRTFTEEEYATMTKVLATVANYSANPSSDSRYNINSCFNAVRADLLSLHEKGLFDYDYPLDDNGHYTWQGALTLLATSADLTQDLNLDTYYSDVAKAFRIINQELLTYGDFAPVKTAHFSTPQSIETDVLIFLITGMEASNNSMYDGGDFNDALRKGYVAGEKSYNDLDQVRKDFDLWEMNYLIGYVACIVFIIVMAICIFTFIVRLFNLLLLYITAPLFAASMPMDDGSKWQSWTQAFIIQLFSGFGIIIAMRLYLIIIPVIVSSDLVFFAGSGVDSALLNRMAQLLMVLGGAWAVLQSGSVIIGILAGNPGMAAIQQEGQIGNKVMGWAMRAPRAAVGSAVGLASSAAKGAKYIGNSKQRSMDKAESKAKLATRQAQRQQSMADARFAKADRMAASGASSDKVARMRASAQRMQNAADKSTERAGDLNARAGTKPSDAAIERDSRYAPGSGAQGGDSGDGALPPRARDAGEADASSAMPPKPDYAPPRPGGDLPPNKPLPTPPQADSLSAPRARGAVKQNMAASGQTVLPDKPLPTPPRPTPPNKPLPTPPQTSSSSAPRARSTGGSERGSVRQNMASSGQAATPNKPLPTPPQARSSVGSTRGSVRQNMASSGQAATPGKPLPTPPKPTPPSKPLPKRPDDRS